MANEDVNLISDYIRKIDINPDVLLNPSKDFSNKHWENNMKIGLHWTFMTNEPMKGSNFYEKRIGSGPDFTREKVII